MQRCKSVFILVTMAACVGWSGIAESATILEPGQLGPFPHTLIDATPITYDAQRFSLQDTWNIETIEPWVWVVSGSLRVQLTTGIGSAPHATIAEWFLAPQGEGFHQIATNLDLGPGDYYLVYSNMSGSASFRYNFVSGTDFYRAPGSAWVNQADPTSSYFNYLGSTSGLRVTGELSNSTEPHPFTVPEPSTMVLLGSSLAGLVCYGRKRPKK